MIGRRLLLLGAGAGLGGCGFHPLYGRYGGYGGALRPELASIYVNVMSERTGQLLRQALQERLVGDDTGEVKRYELSGGLLVVAEALGIQQDSSSTRTRLNATSTWSLRRVDVNNTLVTSGVTRALDGININNQEYFAADLETSAAYKRLADQVADKIVQTLAIYFRAHPATA